MNTENKEITMLKPVDLDKLYKERRYENLFLSSVFMCKLAVLMNIIVIVGRCIYAYMNHIVEPMASVDFIELCVVIVLHFLIIVFALSSLKSLREHA